MIYRFWFPLDPDAFSYRDDGALATFSFCVPLCQIDSDGQGHAARRRGAAGVVVGDPAGPGRHGARLLPAYVDRARSAAVCPQWRAAARQRPPALPPPLPLLALPDGSFYSLPYSKPFRFPGFGCAGYKGAAFGSWLVFPRDNGCFLVDPFAGATVRLPALSSVRLRPPNAADHYVKYQENVTPSGRCFVTWLDIRDSKRVPTLNNLIMCSPNLVAAFVGTGRISQILMCQPGASSWSVRAYDPCAAFEDMAFYQGKLYALADDENRLVVNISQDSSTGNPQVSRIGQVIKGDPDHLFGAWMPDDTTARKKLYLVESHVKMATGPFSDSLWRIPLLGDGDGAKTISTGTYTVEILSPSRMARAGLVRLSPFLIPANSPR